MRDSFLRVCNFPREIAEDLFNIKSEDELDIFLSEILQRKDVREALRTAHPMFTEEFLSSRLGTKQKATLINYILRMSTRATPFGLFSSIGKITVGEERRFFGALKLVTERRQSHDEERSRKSFQDDTHFRTNPCLSFQGSRLEGYFPSGLSGRRNYFFATAALDASTEALLAFTRTPRSFRDLLRFTSTSSRDREDLHSFLSGLVSSGLLETDCELPTIRNEEVTGSGNLINSYLESTSFSIEKNFLEVAAEALSLLRDVTPLWNGESFLWYRKLKDVFRRSVSEPEFPLVEFINTYCRDLDLERTVPPAPTRMHDLLSDWAGTATKKCERMIDLDEKKIRELRALRENDPDLPYAPEYGAVFEPAVSASPYKGRIIHAQESFLGRRGLARFSHVLDDGAGIDDSSEDVIYADIDFSPDGPVADVSRRKRCTKFVIALQYTKKIDERICLYPDDLTVRLVNDKFRLWSRTHAKEVVPVFTSSFIAASSSHALFKFLGFIVQDGRRVFLHFSFGAPSKSFRPGITYKGFVLSEAEWTFSTKELSHLLENPSVRVKQGLPDRLVITMGDRRIPLDLSRPFIARKILSKFPSSILYLREDFSSLHGERVKNESGTHSSEIMFHWKPALPLNRRLSLSAPSPIPRRPGTDPWNIYLYMPVGKMDDFLLTNKAMLRDSFFMKFTTPSPHLRLRFFGLGPARTMKIWNQFLKQKDTFLITDITPVAFLDEESTYGGAEGFALYLELSRAFSRMSIRIIQAAKERSLPLLPSVGDPLLFYSLHRFRVELERTGLFPEEAQLSHRDSVFVRPSSHYWKEYRKWHAADSEESIEIEDIVRDTFRETAPLWKKLAKFLKKKTVSSGRYRARLIHTQAVRLQGGYYSDFEAILPYVADREKKAGLSPR